MSVVQLSSISVDVCIKNLFCRLFLLHAEKVRHKLKIQKPPECWVPPDISGSDFSGYLESIKTFRKFNDI